MITVRLNTKLISSLSDVLFMSAADMIKATHIASTTWYAIMQKPEGITIQYLLAICNGLHVPARRFFSTERADVIGKRDDYIVESYMPCHYDADVLREFVSNRHDATWKKAAKAAGVTYDNLRKSLLAVRRTPVTRFLAACDAFGIDPFTILIDPNPEARLKYRRSGRQDKAKGISEEIDSLRRKVDDLSAEVLSLTERYEALLKRHDSLERIVENYFDQSIGMAADK